MRRANAGCSARWNSYTVEFGYPFAVSQEVRSVQSECGVIGELLLELYAYLFDIPTKEAGTFMIITLIAVGALLTCFGFFDKMANFCKAGLLIPITGFAHSMMSASLEYRKEGLVTGIGANMFKLAGTVIIFGVVSAYVFGLIRLIIFGG